MNRMSVGVCSAQDDMALVNFPYSPTVIPGIIGVLDVISIYIAALIAQLLVTNSSFILYEYYFSTVVFVTLFYIAIARQSKLYSLSVIMRWVSRVDDIVISIITAFLFFLGFAKSFGIFELITQIWVLYFAGLSVLLTVTGRSIASVIIGGLSRRHVIGRNVVVLGAGEQSKRLIKRMNRTHPHFVNLVGVFDPDRAVAGSLGGLPVLGGLEDALRYARQRRIDDVIVAMPWHDDRRVMDIIEALKELPVNVHLSTDLVGFELAFRPVMGDISELPLFEVVQRPISGWSSALKTVEDYVLAGIGLAMISPLLLLLAVLIKLDSPGPVFFKQKRLGFNNEVFEIFKFRSMYHREVPEQVVRQASRSDPRITRVGRIIRATSLDELPQLLNVLNGTMSLVGPRPHALSHNEEYGRRIRGYFARHRVKPGITGWAQVNGLRGETETLDKMEARIRYDVYYTENWSLFFDLKILIMTALLVLFQKNAY